MSNETFFRYVMIIINLQSTIIGTNDKFYRKVAFITYTEVLSLYIYIMTLSSTSP